MREVVHIRLQGQGVGQQNGKTETKIEMGLHSAGGNATMVKAKFI